MYGIVFFSGGDSARLSPRPWLIRGRGVHALPDDGLRTGCLHRPFCHALRRAKSKVDEFQAGNGRPDLARPRSLQKQPAYTGVERNDERDDR
jgi:hypothetical protein